jgi:hypothetical protein
MNLNLAETTDIFKNLKDDADIGYLVEVDLEYPNDIKEYTKNLPLDPDKRTINMKSYQIINTS